MFSRKNFEILHDAMAFLVLFEQILIKFFAPHSKSFSKYDAFVRTFSLYALRGVDPENFGGGCNLE